MATRIQLRRDTTANWVSTNPILKSGEVGLDMTLGKIKAGFNDTTRWNDLPYLNVLPSEIVEISQDSVWAALNGGTHQHIILSYDDTLGRISIGTAPEVVLSSGLTDTLGDYVTTSYFEGLKDEPDGIPTLTSSGFIRNEEIDSTIARIASPTFTGTVGGITKAMVGLSNVNNTTDELKPISTATQTALDLKAPIANPSFTGTTNTANLTVSGNLTVTGATTTQSTANLSVANPLIYVGENNQANIIDVGLVGSFNNGTYQHTGLARDHEANKWKLFKGVVTEPSTVINWTQATLDDLAIGGLTATTISGTTSITSPAITSTTQLNANNLTVTGTLSIPTESIASSDLHWEHYAAEINLPPAADKHGMFAHVHGTGAAYYAHGGSWYKLAKVTDISDNNLTTIVQKSADYTLALTDAFNLIEMSTGTVTIPNDSVVNFPIGTTIDILQTTTSQISIAGSGFTPDSTPGLKLRARWSSATCLKRGVNSWVIFGDLSA